MTYKDALKQYKKVGAAHATGDALRVMYADLIGSLHGGKPEKYYEWLKPGTDHEIIEQARILLRDRQKAWDVLIGIEVTA